MRTANLSSTTSIVCATLACAGASAQHADLSAELAQIRTDLAALKSASGDKWLTDERVTEIKSLVCDLLADATTRTTLQNAGATSGYNNGFFIGSADGNFKLTANVLTQARFTYNHQSANPTDTPDPGQTSSNLWAFEARRTELAFTGNVVDPSWTYAMRFNYGSTIDPYTPIANAMVLQDAWIAKDLGNDFSVKFGQFKSPFMAESLHNDGAQLTAERSLVDYYFSGGFTQGVAVTYSGDHLRATGAYDNGPRSQNDSWAVGSNNSISLAGRIEWKAMGSWSQFETESANTSDEAALMIGAAIQYYNNRGASLTNIYAPSVPSMIYGGQGTMTTAATDWTIDATYKAHGLSACVAFVGANYAASISEFAPFSRFGSYGFVFQGGYRVTDTLECFGRWEWVDIADGAASPNGTVVTGINNVLTCGVNVYASASVKWTTQFGISLSAIGFGTDVQGAGYRSDNNTNASDQFNIISQFQVGF